MPPEFLYLTADRIGAPTGGGQVTKHESEALAELGECEAWNFPEADRPWGSDAQAMNALSRRSDVRPRLCHIYAGCFTETVALLQSRGCKVVYTVAAHDRHVSREEHQALGLPFPYTHLTDDAEWRRYIGGILAADVVVVPGEAPRRVLEREGVDPERMRVIPHGHTPPDKVAPMPAGFHVGYLGACTPDKGLRYLIEAWAVLNRERPAEYRDAVLHIAGHGAPDLLPLVRYFGAGSVNLRGYLASPSMLYNSVNLYVQPAATTGFDLEVLEALSHGRPVVCSDGAGAAEYATVRVSARSAAALAQAIDQRVARLPAPFVSARMTDLAWPAVRESYKRIWREALA